MVGVLRVQHTNCWLQHLHELFDFPFCLKKLFFFCFFLLFLFFARHNLLHYNSSWHVEDITNAKKTNIQNQCCCSLPNIEISIWSYTERTEDKVEVLFFYLNQSCRATHFSPSIAKGQGRLTKGTSFSRMKTMCVFTGMRRRATHVLHGRFRTWVSAHW